MRYLLLSLVVLPLAGQQYYPYVQWNQFTVNPAPPPCGSQPFTLNQTGTQTYTIECVAYTTHIGIRSGSVSASATGACPGIIGNYCTTSQMGVGPAPGYQSQYNVQGSNFGIWINTDSVALGSDGMSCGGETLSAGPTKLEAIPSCPYYPPPPSPIIIDPTGEGFHLTDKAHGVRFRQQFDSPLQQMSWTDPAYHNAWLVRPNTDGSVRSLADNMFGNLTPQPPSSHPNGYAALVYWMSEEGCGTNLSHLDSMNCPAVWGKLRLWQDINQDGVAQPGELHTLTDLGVYAISLRYHESDSVDQYGNQFRYTAHIWDAAGVDQANRTYDVFLLVN